MATTPQVRQSADKAKVAPPKPETKPATTPGRVLQDTRPVSTGDQTSVPAQGSGDQKRVKGSGKKKHSPTVIAWQALQKEKAYTSGTITLTDKGRADNPKRKNALVKFKLYQDGMSVQEYIEASNKIGTPKATAQADVRWDVAKGLIIVK